MYPEKQILDVAGFPSVKGRELVDGAGRAGRRPPSRRTSSTAPRPRSTTDDDGVTVDLDDGTDVRARAVIITAGIGKFSPRPLPAGDGWEGRGLEFFVPSFAPYAGKDVVIVGGGDSAFDWALQPRAGSPRSVDAGAPPRRVPRPPAHRRRRSRSPHVEIITKAQVTALVGERHAGVGRDRPSTARPSPGPAQALVAALGFIADLGPLQSGGIEVEKRHIVVDSAMRTNLPRVFAAGDITEYDGKVRLIAVGFGEAATAVNNAAVAIDPTAHVFPGHSSEGT